MSGDEAFQVVTCIGARSVPRYLFESALAAHFQEMCDTLSTEAISRGAKRPPKLEIKDLDLGRPVDLSASNGTIRYMLPFKRD